MVTLPVVKRVERKVVSGRQTEECRLPKTYAYMVLAGAREGRSDAYEAWYENQHIPDVLRIPGIVGARRYRPSETQRGGQALDHDFMTVFQVEADDIRDVFAELDRRKGTDLLPLSADGDPARSRVMVWELASECSAEA